MPKKDLMYYYRKWSLTIRILPLVLLITILKLGAHQFGYEFISSNPFLPSFVAATVFLIGFLLSGVLTDYKESEKLPGEIVSSMETIADEAYIIYRNKRTPAAKDFLERMLDFSKGLEQWFYKEIKTKDLLLMLRRFNDSYTELEPHVQGTFLNRMKQEQHNLRRLIIRIHSIKDTSFVPSGYAIVEGISILLIFSMLFTKLEPFFESMFFIVPMTYLLVYMIFLIKDLDNPFDYDTKGETTDEVSIKEIHDEVKRLEDRLEEMEGLG